MDTTIRNRLILELINKNKIISFKKNKLGSHNPSTYLMKITKKQNIDDSAKENLVEHEVVVESYAESCITTRSLKHIFSTLLKKIKKRL